MLNKRILVLMFLLIFIPLTIVGCRPTPTPSNETPILTSYPVTTATVGVEYTYNVNATDPDGDTLTYSLVTKPIGMTINSVSGLIKWTPTAKGNYAVVVKVSDGDLDIIQNFTIVVSESPAFNQSPVASFTASPTSGVVPLEVFFDASGSYDPEGNILSYEWDFKDGDAGSGKIVNHTFSSIGNYDVRLIVTDDKGATNSTTKFITVTEIPNQSPVASFTAIPISGIAPLEVYFNASNSYDSDGSIISYTWNFGDGSNGFGITTSHIYKNSGDYTVQLTVSDNDSAFDSITMGIEVISGTTVDGIISSNTTWTIDNSPYIIINEDLQIAQNVTLLIEEGVIVKAKQWRMIKVAGNLNTNGSESSPVKFTSLGSSKWWGIEFINSSNSSINNTIIENAERAIDLKGLSPVIFIGNTFKYNGWVVTDTYGYQNMHFLNNTFVNNEEVFYGIRTSGDLNRFENNVFIDNNNVFSFGYYIGQTVIKNNNFLNNNFIVRAPELGYGYGTIDISNNWWGTTDMSIIDSYIEDGKDDVSLQTLSYEPIKNTEISNIGSPISVE